MAGGGGSGVLGKWQLKGSVGVAFYNFYYYFSFFSSYVFHCCHLKAQQVFMTARWMDDCLVARLNGWITEWK